MESLYEARLSAGWQKEKHIPPVRRETTLSVCTRFRNTVRGVQKLHTYSLIAFCELDTIVVNPRILGSTLLRVKVYLLALSRRITVLKCLYQFRDCRLAVPSKRDGFT